MDIDFTKEYKEVYMSIHNQIANNFQMYHENKLNYDTCIERCNDLKIQLKTDLLEVVIKHLDIKAKDDNEAREIGKKYFDKAIQDFHSVYNDLKILRGLNQIGPMLCDRTEVERQLYRLAILTTNSTTNLLDVIDELYNEKKYKKDSLPTIKKVIN